MARKITLPPPDVVVRWKEDKVIKWLKRMQLDDCVPAFEHRQINGSKLLDLTEQKLFSFQDLKIKRRGQISKCVNECKSQATNAKRIVGTIRHRKSKERPLDGALENGDNYDSEDEFDYWDSDFDEDFDDEGVESKDTEISLTPESSADIKVDETTNFPAKTRGNEVIEPLCARLIPEPPDVTAGPAVFAANSQKTVLRSTISRPPLKRPPSQPPPPPVSHVFSLDEKGPLEDYEIPISHQANHQASVPSPTLTPCESTLSMSSSLSEISSPPETYEIVEPHEENYEIVESPPLPEKAEKPLLPPRLVSMTSRPCQPPPLPQKPKKFQEVTCMDKTDGYRSLNRPRLPLKQDDEGINDNIPLSTSGIGSAILNSFLGRRNSLPSPKVNSSSKDVNSNDAIISNQVLNASSTCSKSSRSSSVKEGLSKVGNSTFVSAASLGEPINKSGPLSSIDHDEIAQNMATRPLPPVPKPQPQKDKCSEPEGDIETFPWFHEIERHHAEEKIRNFSHSGSFLVRPSKRAGKDNPYTLTILHNGKIFHLNIRQRPDGTFALGKEKVKEKNFPTIVKLITYHQSEPILLTSRGESAGQTVLRVFPGKQ